MTRHAIVDRPAIQNVVPRTRTFAAPAKNRSKLARPEAAGVGNSVTLRWPMTTSGTTKKTSRNAMAGSARIAQRLAIGPLARRPDRQVRGWAMCVGRSDS